MSYIAIKHTHLLFAVISILFFNVRFIGYFSKEKPPIVRIAPHIIDTIFFTLGIVLIVKSGLIPFKTGGGWLTIKLFLLLFYIGFGVIAMRQNRCNTTRFIMYFLANGMVVGMVYLALAKPFIF